MLQGQYITWAPKVDYVQAGAPSHTARNTIVYLWYEYVAFIKSNVPPSHNSPDLKWVEYAICSHEEWVSLAMNAAKSVVVCAWASPQTQ